MTGDFSKISNGTQAFFKKKPQQDVPKNVADLAKEMMIFADKNDSAILQSQFQTRLAQMESLNTKDLIKFIRSFDKDESIIELICDEIGDDKKTRKEACLRVLNALVNSAKDVDLSDLKKQFEDELNSQFRFFGKYINTEKLDNIINAITQAIEDRQNFTKEEWQNLQNTSSAEGQKNANKVLEERLEKAYSAFGERVGEDGEMTNVKKVLVNIKTGEKTEVKYEDGQMQRDGIYADIADGVSGIFGSENTADKVRKDLKIANAQLQELKKAQLEGEEAYKAKFKEIFGVEYDYTKHLSFQKNQEVYLKAAPKHELEMTFNRRFKALLSNAPLRDEKELVSADPSTNVMIETVTANKATVFKREYNNLVELMGENGEAILTELFEKNGVANASIEDKFEVMKSFAKKWSNELHKETLEACGGKSFSEIQAKYDNSYKAAYGVENDIMKRVNDYNTSQQIGGQVVKAGVVMAASMVAACSGMGLVGVAGVTSVATVLSEVTDRGSSGKALNTLKEEGFTAYVKTVNDDIDWEATLKQAVISGGSVLIGGAVAKGVNFVMQGQTPIAQAVAMFGADVLTDTALEYVTTGTITIEGVMFAVALSAVGNIIAYKQLSAAADVANSVDEAIDGAIAQPKVDAKTKLANAGFTDDVIANLKAQSGYGPELVDEVLDMIVYLEDQVSAGKPITKELIESAIDLYSPGATGGSAYTQRTMIANTWNRGDEVFNAYGQKAPGQSTFSTGNMKAKYNKIKNGINDYIDYKKWEWGLDNPTAKTSAVDTSSPTTDFATKLADVKGPDGQPFLSKSEIDNLLENCQHGFVTDGKPIPDFEARIMAVLSNPEEIASLADWKSRSAGVWRAIQDPLQSTVDINPAAFGAKPKVDVSAFESQFKAAHSTNDLESLVRTAKTAEELDVIINGLTSKDITVNRQLIESIIEDALNKKNLLSGSGSRVVENLINGTGRVKIYDIDGNLIEKRIMFQGLVDDVIKYSPSGEWLPTRYNMGSLAKLDRAGFTDDVIVNLKAQSDFYGPKLVDEVLDMVVYLEDQVAAGKPITKELIESAIDLYSPGASGGSAYTQRSMIANTWNRGDEVFRAYGQTPPVKASKPVSQVAKSSVTTVGNKCILPQNMKYDSGNIGDVTVKVASGDMTAVKADAYLVPEFQTCASEGGVGAAIWRNGGGKGLEAYDNIIKTQGKQDFGSVHITESGGGNSQKLIHAVTVGSGAENEFEVVQKAVYNALKSAEEQGLSSVAMPALGTGIIGNLTNEQSAQAMMSAIRQFSNEGGQMDVTFVIYGSPKGYDGFVNTMKTGSYTSAVPTVGAREFDQARFLMGLANDGTDVDATIMAKKATADVIENVPVKSVTQTVQTSTLDLSAGMRVSDIDDFMTNCQAYATKNGLTVEVGKHKTFKDPVITFKDGSGNTVRELQYIGSELFDDTMITYNTKGQVVNETRYLASDGRFADNIQYFYDSEGNITYSTKLYDKDVIDVAIWENGRGMRQGAGVFYTQAEAKAKYGIDIDQSMIGSTNGSASTKPIPADIPTMPTIDDIGVKPKATATAGGTDFATKQNLTNLQTQLFVNDSPNVFDLKALKKWGENNGLKVIVKSENSGNKLLLFKDNNGNIVRRVAENSENLGTIYADYRMFYEGSRELGGKICYYDESSPKFYQRLGNGRTVFVSEGDLKSLVIATNQMSALQKGNVVSDFATKLADVKGPDGQPFLSKSEIDNLLENCQHGFVTDGKPIPDFEARIMAVLSNPEEIASLADWKSRSAGVWRAIQDPLQSTVDLNPTAFGVKPKATAASSKASAIEMSVADRLAKEGVPVNISNKYSKAMDYISPYIVGNQDELAKFAKKYLANPEGFEKALNDIDIRAREVNYRRHNYELYGLARSEGYSNYERMHKEIERLTKLIVSILE